MWKQRKCLSTNHSACCLTVELSEGLYLGLVSQSVQTGRTWPGCPPLWTCWAVPRWLPAHGFVSWCAGAWQRLWGGRTMCGAPAVGPAARPAAWSSGSDEEAARLDGLTGSGPWWNPCRTRLCPARQKVYSLNGFSEDHLNIKCLDLNQILRFWSEQRMKKHYCLGFIEVYRCTANPTTPSHPYALIWHLCLTIQCCNPVEKYHEIAGFFFCLVSIQSQFQSQSKSPNLQTNAMLHMLPCVNVNQLFSHWSEREFNQEKKYWSNAWWINKICSKETDITWVVLVMTLYYIWTDVDGRHDFMWLRLKFGVYTLCSHYKQIAPDALFLEISATCFDLDP